MATHRIGGKTYVVTFVLLLALTLLSYVLHLLPLGAFGTPAAFVIAAIKVLLVVAFFMHLYESGFVLHLVALTLAAFIALMCLGVSADVLAR